MIFNLATIEEGIRKGDFREINGVKVLDGRTEAKSLYTRYIPVPNSSYGCNAPPDGKYIMLNGKLPPTVIALGMSKLDDLFAGEVKERDVIVTEPQLGLGPLHAAFDGRGSTYTTLFISGQMAKWDIDDAIKTYKGKKIGPVKQELDTHY